MQPGCFYLQDCSSSGVPWLAWWAATAEVVALCLCFLVREGREWNATLILHWAGHMLSVWHTHAAWWRCWWWMWAKFLCYCFVETHINPLLIWQYRAWKVTLLSKIRASAFREIGPFLSLSWLHYIWILEDASLLAECLPIWHFSLVLHIYLNLFFISSCKTVCADCLVTLATSVIWKTMLIFHQL